MLINVSNDIWVSDHPITLLNLCNFLADKSIYTKIYLTTKSTPSEYDIVIYEFNGLYSLNTLDCLYSNENLSPIDAVMFVKIRTLSDLLSIINKKIILPNNITTTYLKIFWKHIKIGDFDIKYDFMDNLEIYLYLSHYISINYPNYKKVRPFTSSLLNYSNLIFIEGAELQYFRKPSTVYINISNNDTNPDLKYFPCLQLQALPLSSESLESQNTITPVYTLIFL